MAPREVLTVTAYPHPFSDADAIRASMPRGVTPGELLDAIDWPLTRDRYTCIFVDGVEVLRPQWDTLALARAGHVAIRLRPAGDGGSKQIIGLIAVIGLALVAPQIAGMVFAKGSLAATALAAGITVAGSLAISAIFKPPLPNIGSQGSVNQSFSILAQSNQVTPYATIPRVYGRLRVFPRVAVIPYSVNLSGANFLHAVYDFGYGPLSIEDIRIGATPLTNYQGVSFVVHEAWQKGDALELVSGDQQSEAVAVTLDVEPQEGTRTTPPGTKQAVIDINFPLGIYPIGPITPGAVVFAAFQLYIDGVELAPPAAEVINMQASRPGVGLYYGDQGFGFHSFIFVSNDNKVGEAFSVSAWIEFGTAGEHEIRIVCRNPAVEESTRMRKATWWQLRTIGEGVALAVEPAHTILEVRVRANDQLSGTIDTLSAIATSKLSIWDGDSWSAPTPTRNPAWIFADILRGNAANRPVADARIDLAELLEWSEDCDDEAANDPGAPQYCCDIIFDWAATVREALQTVAACGRAALNMRDGKFSVIRDIDPGAPVQLITKRNSWDFSASLPYLDKAHGLSITFVDELTWTENTLKVYADGYSAGTATLFEDLKLPGIIRHNQVWRFGRYYLAEALLRRERASLQMDMENLVAQRGDMVAVAHDVMRVGGFPARVVEVVGGTVRVDEAISFGAATAIRVRKSDTRGLGAIIPASVSGPYTYLVADASDIEPGDLLVAGTADVIVGEYIVDKVVPGLYPNATLELVEHRPEVRTADTGPIPPRTPKPGLEPDGTLASPAPLIPLVNLAVRDGARVYDITLNWSASPLATLYRVMIQENGAWREIGTTKDTRFNYELPAGIATAGDATFGVQAWSDFGVGSEIATAVVPLDPVNDAWPPPPTPGGITATPREIDVEIRWDAVAYDFIDFYRVRLGESWDDYIGEWTNKTLVQSIPPQLVGTYKVWIKTVDPTGRESDTAGGPATFTVLAPLQVSIVGMTVTNTAYLRWGSLALGDPGWTAQTTHRIGYYEIAKALLIAPALEAAPLFRRMPLPYRLRFPARRRMLPHWPGRQLGYPAVFDDFEEAQGVGRSSTEFSVLAEQQEGSWRYAVRAVDVAGNVAPWAFIDLLLTPPDNYFLLDHVDNIVPLSTPDDALGFDGHFTKTPPPNSDAYIMPFDTAQTWQSHFTANGWATPQAQVDAGFPLFAQPPSASSSLTFEHDYVDTIPQVRLTLRPAFDTLALDPVVRGEVYTKLDPADPWTLAFAGLVGIVPDNARFIRAVVIVEPGTGGTGMVRMHTIDYTLDVHYVTDQGMDPVAIGGTFVPFNVTFNNVVAVQLTPASSNVAYCQFELADPPNGMTLYAFDHNAAPVAGSVSWTVRGY